MNMHLKKNINKFPCFTENERLKGSFYLFSYLRDFSFKPDFNHLKGISLVYVFAVPRNKIPPMTNAHRFKFSF